MERGEGREEKIGSVEEPLVPNSGTLEPPLMM